MLMCVILAGSAFDPNIEPSLVLRADSHKEINLRWFSYDIPVGHGLVLADAVVVLYAINNRFTIIVTTQILAKKSCLLIVQQRRDEIRTAPLILTQATVHQLAWSLP